MDLQYIIHFEFYGETNELEKIDQCVRKYEREYEDRDIEVIKQLAVACGIEKEKADFFIDEHHPARLYSVFKFSHSLTVSFTTHPRTAKLLKLMMFNIKGSCKYTWMCFGNEFDSGSFYDEDLQNYTEDLLNAKDYDSIDDVEDMLLYNEECDFYFEVDNLEESINYWCEYNEIDPEEYTQEQLIELISNSSGDVVSFFKKETYIAPCDCKRIAKIICKGDEHTILKLYNAAKYAIDDYSGDCDKFIKYFDEEESSLSGCKLLDAKFTNNDGKDCELEINAISYFDNRSVEFGKINRCQIIDDFKFAMGIMYAIDEDGDFDYDGYDEDDISLYANMYSVDIDNIAECEIKLKDCPQVGYLSVNAQDEFGEAANFLMCDYLDKLIDRWCELVHYDGDRKEATEMLAVINNYSYQKESTKIQAGLISAND